MDTLPCLGSHPLLLAHFVGLQGHDRIEELSPQLRLPLRDLLAQLGTVQLVILRFEPI